MERASRLFSYVLVLVSTFMAAWGALGLLEYFTGLAPIVPLQNQAFPPGLQLMHFVALTSR